MAIVQSKNKKRRLAPFKKKPLAPKKWVRFVIYVPNDFYLVALDTIEQYKKITESEKTFPAIEAIFLEARNSLSAY